MNKYFGKTKMPRVYSIINFPVYISTYSHLRPSKHMGKGYCNIEELTVSVEPENLF